MSARRFASIKHNLENIIVYGNGEECIRTRVDHPLLSIDFCRAQARQPAAAKVEAGKWEDLRREVRT